MNKCLSSIVGVVNACINAGIHFRTATEDGTTLGAAVAEYVLDHKFQRVH